MTAVSNALKPSDGSCRLLKAEKRGFLADVGYFLPPDRGSNDSGGETVPDGAVGGYRLCQTCTSRQFTCQFMDERGRSRELVMEHIAMTRYA